MIYPGKTTGEIAEAVDSIAVVSLPSHVIIHTGTNNLPTESAESCVTAVKSLTLKVKSKFPYSSIGLSGIVYRGDINVDCQHIEVKESVESTVNISNHSDFLPSGRGFKTAGLNINSPTKHIDELRILLTDYSNDILSVNETKLDDSIKLVRSKYQAISLFVVIETDKDAGVGFCIKTSINFVVPSDLNVLNLENICIRNP